VDGYFATDLQMSGPILGLNLHFRGAKKGSIVDYGAAWAQVGSVPFSFYKAYPTEGGIRAPLIVAGPRVKQSGDLSHAVLHVTDVVPTLLDLASAKHPSQKVGSPLVPIRGKSLVPLLTGRAKAVRTEQDWLGWEFFGNRAIRQGDWKLVYLSKGAGGPGDWQLFNLRNDPGETRDLSKDNPGKRRVLLTLWDEYVKANGVILTDDGPFAGGHIELFRYGSARGPVDVAGPPHQRSADAAVAQDVAQDASGGTDRGRRMAARWGQTGNAWDSPGG
jgi:arylsulfatase A-like enzyme